MPSENLIFEGHIIDSLTLPKVFDEIIDRGAEYEVLELVIGVHHTDTSHARIKVTAVGDDELDDLIDSLTQYGAITETVEDAEIVVADVDGSFPAGFYSTTNFDTEVRIAGKWTRVERPEMDCGLVVDESRVYTMPMSDCKVGMNVVMRGFGIRVLPLDKPRGETGGFEFMSSDISSEKPKALIVEQIAQQMRDVKANGGRILWVAGPAVIHTGAAPDVSALIRGGYVDALFAGNGVAAHDIESNIYGTSLGVYLKEGTAAEHGHEHHIRAINELRRHGSFKAAIDAGLFSDGIIYNLVTRNLDYLFGGSVRDDGPLPETVSDMMEVQTKLREIIWGKDGKPPIAFCIVVGTMLHGIATGNCLPASVPLVCVDINQATVTKLMDRGSWQSTGVITDVGLFIRGLAEQLTPEEVVARS